MLSLFVLYVHGQNKIVRKIGATLPGVIKVMAQSKISMMNQVFNIQNYKIGLGNNVSCK